MRASVRAKQARRAEHRQREYQTDKSRHIAEALDHIVLGQIAYAHAVRARIERLAPIAPDARMLEVGSGAHGLIFFLGLPNAVGIDPLADEYRSLFPQWQSRAQTLKGYGEALPFEDASFDLVLSDNVIDHAERPDAILSEIVRVLRPGGTLYFTVHVHHPIYAAAAALHGAWNALGLRYEIGPFADHTEHFTLRAIRSRIRALPLRVLAEDAGIETALSEARECAPRHMGDRLKRVFFKNARFEVVAQRISSAGPP